MLVSNAYNHAVDEPYGYNRRTFVTFKALTSRSVYNARVIFYVIPDMFYGVEA